MLKGPKAKTAAAFIALALLGSACSSRDDDDSSTSDDGGSEEAADSSIDTADCAVDPTVDIEGDTIKLVSSYPQSGLTAAFSEIARGWKAYFDKVNAEGGVEIDGTSYMIEYDDKDDEYNPAKTSANIDEMVGADGEGAFATFSVVGTANNIAIRDSLGDLCVPNVFASTGSPAWGNPEYPWTIGSSLSPYTLEGYLFAQVLEEEKPDATIAMLVQDDDFGEAYQQGLEMAIDGTDLEIVKVEKYPTGASEVAAQMTSLAATDADAFFDGGTLIACPDALTQAANAGWEPITWVSSTCASKTLMGLAGPAAEGVYTASNLKDPLDPQWDDDEAMVEYLDTINEYQPDEFDPENAIVGYGYTLGAMFIEALENAEAPNRLAVMESLHNMEVSEIGLLRPDITLTTDGEDDPYFGETLMVAQYEYTGEGERNHFVEVGDLVDFEGQTAELTPADLING